VRSFVKFSHGRIVSDDPHAPGVEIGRPGKTYRRIRIESDFGKLTAFATDGHLPYPYGRELTGYEVADLSATLAKAEAAGVRVLAGPYASDGRNSALVEFPGGYIAEIHEMIIQGIFPWRLTRELYAAKPDYIDQLAAFMRSRPKQPLDGFIPVTLTIAPPCSEHAVLPYQRVKERGPDMEKDGREEQKCEDRVGVAQEGIKPRHYAA
jgi:hypothetical protein